MDIITLETENVNKKIWDGFDEEFYKAEEDFYAHKYNFADVDKLSTLQRKVDKIVFEFGLGAGVDASIKRVSQITNNVNGHIIDNSYGMFVSEKSERSDKKPYPEHVDKYSLSGKLGGKLGEIVGWLNEHGHDGEAQAVAVCGTKTNAVDLRCLAEHRYAKQIFCGRQYCPRCGEEDSVIHQQRYSRSWDRLMWAPALGKIVLTVPEELRDDFKSIDKLGKLHKAGWACVKEVWERDIVKEDGEIEKGIDIGGSMTTVHFFGDEDEKGDRYDKFHPHVNVTFPLCSEEKLMVSMERLEALRGKWYDMMEELTGKKISLTEDGRKRENAWYGFSATEAHKAHWLKYALRPTVGAERFRRLDDDMREFIVTSLVGFHNVRWYGKLSNRTFPKYKRDYLENTPFYQEFLSKKQEKPVVRDFKYCPICHGQLKVHKHKGKIEILENIHRTWYEISDGFWCDEPTYKILVRKGLVGADGKFSGSSP